MILLNPHIESKTILSNIMEWVQQKPSGNTYMRNIIRGYVHYVYSQYNKILIENIRVNAVNAGKVLTKAKTNEIVDYILTEYYEINKHEFNDLAKKPVSEELPFGRHLNH
jgi:hypothetical protein